MAAIILPRRHYTQPQGRVEVAPNWRNGFIAAFGPQSHLVTQSSTTFLAAGRDGVMLSASPSSNGAQVANRRIVAGLEYSTSLAILSLPAVENTAHGQAIYCERSNDQQIYKLTLAPSGDEISYVVRNASNTLHNNVTKVHVPANRRRLFVAAFVTDGGSNRRVFAAGDSATNTNLLAINFTACNDVRLCGDAIDSSSYLRSGLLHVVLFNRALSDEELRDIDGSPWQLFRAEPVRIYSLPPVIPTLSSPGVIDITATSARPQVTLTY